MNFSPYDRNNFFEGRAGMGEEGRGVMGCETDRNKRGSRGTRKERKKVTFIVRLLGPVTRSRSSTNPKRIGGRANVSAAVRDTFLAPT